MPLILDLKNTFTYDKVAKGTCNACYFLGHVTDTSTGQNRITNTIIITIQCGGGERPRQLLHNINNTSVSSIFSFARDNKCYKLAQITEVTCLPLSKSFPGSDATLYVLSSASSILLLFFPSRVC